jgi:hypothetical protein
MISKFSLEKYSFCKHYPALLHQSTANHNNNSSSNNIISKNKNNNKSMALHCRSISQTKGEKAVGVCYRGWIQLSVGVFTIVNSMNQVSHFIFLLITQLIPNIIGIYL